MEISIHYFVLVYCRLDYLIKLSLKNSSKCRLCNPLKLLKNNWRMNNEPLLVSIYGKVGEVVTFSGCFDPAHICQSDKPELHFWWSCLMKGTEINEWPLRFKVKYIWVSIGKLPWYWARVEKNSWGSAPTWKPSSIWNPNAYCWGSPETFKHRI